MAKKILDETKVKKDCYFYKRIKDLECFRTQACEDCGALSEMVCGYGDCSFFKTIEEETEAQSKYPFDRNYKITLAMKEFDRTVTEKENEKAAKEVKKNEKLPDTL